MALASALVLLLPLTDSAATSELTALSLILLALASALACATRIVTSLSAQVVGYPVTGDPRPPVLRTRKTDPTHHPLAPRAPGLA